MEGRLILDGQYRIQNLIGHGGWGACYVAEHTKSSKESKVAVKCIPRQGLNFRERAYIAREIKYHKQASCVAHGGIVAFIDHGVDEDEDIVYLVTEYCSKGDLFSSVRTHRLSGRHSKIKRRVLQIIDAVQAMHDAGIYHRDLKPENIFVRKDKSLAIGDFGFATDHETTANFNLGTPRYMSPGAY